MRTENPFSALAGEIALPREVTRLVRFAGHEEGHHATNFLADIFDMQALPGPGLTIPDTDTLDSLMGCVVPSEHAPDGLAVMMTQAQWSRFIGVRRRYLTSKHALQNLEKRLFTHLPLATHTRLGIPHGEPEAATSVAEQDQQP